MEYTQVPANAFEKLQLNAGVLADGFTPSTGVIGNILAATTGGLTFASNPNFMDFGEDVDNVPANTWQLKRVTSYDPVISGTLVSVDSAMVKSLVGGAEYGVTGSGTTTTDTTHIIPLAELKEADFDDIWLICDYSDKNVTSGTGTSATTAGYIAIHIMNALNTTGFQLKTSKDAKGNFAFEYHGHYDLEDIDTVPFEIYIKAGTAPSS